MAEKKKASPAKKSVLKAKSKADEANDEYRDAKLRYFRASDVANRDGAAVNPDGSIMSRAGALGSTASHAGSMRVQYGTDGKSVYDYGFIPEKGGVASGARKKLSEVKKKQPTKKMAKGGMVTKANCGASMKPTQKKAK
jgi:hypothetical protein